MEQNNNNKIHQENTLWFEKVYNNLIEKAKSRGLSKTRLDGYYELHHILPRCLGGEDSAENFVLLTAREHYIAHKLLYRIHPDNYGLLKSVVMMSNRHGEILASSREFEYYRSEYVKRTSICQKDRIITNEHREKLKKSGKGKHYNFDKEHCNNISKGKKGKPYGTKVIDKDGNLFDTITSCADFYGYCQSTIKFWIIEKPEKGFKLYKDGDKFKNHYNRFGELITNDSKPHPRYRKIIGPNGEIYNNIKECINKVGIERSTLLDWINNHPEKGFKFKD